MNAVALRLSAERVTLADALALLPVDPRPVEAPPVPEEVVRAGTERRKVMVLVIRRLSCRYCGDFAHHEDECGRREVEAIEYARFRAELDADSDFEGRR
jgi:hypothetical protein